MSCGFTYVASTHAKPFNPMAGKPLLQPAHRVFGYSAQQKVEWALAIAVRNAAGAESHYTACCAELGKANACGQVNMRAALKALAAAQNAILAFAAETA